MPPDTTSVVEALEDVRAVLERILVCLESLDRKTKEPK